MIQSTFDFYPDVKVDEGISKFPWTKIKENQWVKTTRTETYYTTERGMFDAEIEIKHSKTVEEVWAVRLLPVLVSKYGNFFKLPLYFDTIERIS